MDESGPTTPPPAGRAHGEIGVLAYDELDDRIQCHVCGGWYQKLESRHLRLHGLTVPSYKECYGLNADQPLETPRITALRRAKNLEHEGWRNLVADYRFVPGGSMPTAVRRAQFRRRHYAPEEQRRRAREWTDEELVAYLRELQARHDGTLLVAHLDLDRPGGRGVRPSRNAILERLGGWPRICALLGQPHRIGRPRSTSAWSNARYRYRTLSAAYAAAARGLASDSTSMVRLAPDLVAGVRENPVLWTDGTAYRVYEDVPGGAGMATSEPVPALWRGGAPEGRG